MTLGEAAARAVAAIEGFAAAMRAPYPRPAYLAGRRPRRG